jgi:hypothetical protein
MDTAGKRPDAGLADHGNITGIGPKIRPAESRSLFPPFGTAAMAARRPAAATYASFEKMASRAAIPQTARNTCEFSIRMHLSRLLIILNSIDAGRPNTPEKNTFFPAFPHEKKNRPARLQKFSTAARGMAAIFMTPKRPPLPAATQQRIAREARCAASAGSAALPRGQKVTLQLLM